jgi:invasion protein IalB
MFVAQQSRPQTGAAMPLRTTILHAPQVWTDAAKRLAVDGGGNNPIFASFSGNLLLFPQRLPVPLSGGMSQSDRFYYRIRIRSPVRIRFSPFVLAVAGLMMLSPMVSAQEEKVDGEVPATLGPRAGAAAAQGQQQAPKSEVISTHGKWAVQCTELPADQGGKSCGMIQNAKNDKDERIAISVVVSRMKRDGKVVTFMRILAPIGVYLPTGIPVEIDGAALPNRMRFW